MELIKNILTGRFGADLVGPPVDWNSLLEPIPSVDAVNSTDSVQNPKDKVVENVG